MEGTKLAGDFHRSSRGSCLSSTSMPTSNGHVSDMPVFPADAEYDDGERAGVFDYMPLKARPRPDTACSYVQNGHDSEDSSRREWARERESTLKSSVDYSHDKEMTMFRYSAGSTGLNQQCSSDYSKNSHSVNGADAPDAVSDPDEYLQEIVVHSEVAPQRASYERFNSNSQRYRPANNAAPVYVTNIQRSADQKTGWLVSCPDERDVVERRSQNTHCK
jgi:hypothetical protein